MISEVLEEAEVKICNIVRKKLHDRKAPVAQMAILMKDIARSVENITGFGARWVAEDESFSDNESKLFISDEGYYPEIDPVEYPVCCYRIKYNAEQNLFIATEIW
ncbi:hypothetical protein DUK53_16820 [Listeria sp. SHR_NRA_18]|uniref:hypothetical protein n=1 Tax=Listeria sp. SHR_NRA_18 TaxID=2269046 RepID=UPI000F5E1226|nr:hypothetical protein [Listeria sp. SHR_NRA_18]RQW65351.1 hypothetical protein DUK53_16820 [Listeria sp. SHR_NRA_18]